MKISNICYIDISQPDVLKYKIIDFSDKLYEYCILSNIANNCNLYDHQTQLECIEHRINYFLQTISFIFGQALNITNISKTNDPFLQQMQKVLLELRMRQETSLYWPKENLFPLPNPFFQKVTNHSSKLGNIMSYKNGHNSQKYRNIHLYRILAENWLKDLHEISQSFLLLFDQLTEAITHAATNLWHPMLLPDTFLGSKSNKEDPYLSTSLFSMVLPLAEVQYFLFDKCLIFTMTIRIPSTKEFQLFKSHPIPIYLDFNTDVISSVYMKPQIPYLAISSNNQSYFTTNENFLNACYQNGFQTFCHTPRSISKTNNNPAFVKHQWF